MKRSTLLVVLFAGLYIGFPFTPEGWQVRSALRANWYNPAKLVSAGKWENPNGTSWFFQDPTRQYPNEVIVVRIEKGLGRWGIPNVFLIRSGAMSI